VRGGQQASYPSLSSRLPQTFGIATNFLSKLDFVADFVAIFFLGIFYIYSSYYLYYSILRNKKIERRIASIARVFWKSIHKKNTKL
jgi:O-antigen/teichoic acid export membrane protein